MKLEDLLALWPIATSIASIACRIASVRIRDDLTARLVVDQVALILAIGSGVGYGLLFGARVMF